MTRAAAARPVLLARLITAAVLIAGSVAAMFLLGRWGWTWALLAVLLVAAREWTTLSGYGQIASLAYCGALAAAGLALHGAGAGLASFADGRVEIAVYAAGCVFWIFVAPSLLAAGRLPRGRIAAAAAGCIVLLPAWLAVARLQADPLSLLQIMAIVWIADSAAYFCGRAWGRRKLAPRISPGKTWEGVGGAAAAVAVYYALLTAFPASSSWVGGWRGAALVAGVAALSIVGDLFESAMKRQAGVKDSGVLLPGHGGVLDRIDGLLAGLPLAALLLRLPG